jgi:predicted nucleic acid-binding protein
MIRVVLDANVYVSAVLKPPSNPGQIIDLVRRNAVHSG